MQLFRLWVLMALGSSLAGTDVTRQITGVCVERDLGVPFYRFGTLSVT